MTTEAGGGYCWRPLAMNLHAGGLGVMVALMSTWSDDPFCILPEWQSSPPQDIIAFPGKGGEEKRIPKESSRHLSFLVAAASWISNLVVHRELLHVQTIKSSLYNIDIASLSETRLPENSPLEEHRSGYTFFWSYRLANESRQSGVDFAIRNYCLKLPDKLPERINDRLATMRMKGNNSHVTFISTYTCRPRHTQTRPRKNITSSYIMPSCLNHTLTMYSYLAILMLALDRAIQHGIKYLVIMGSERKT